jgi:hypothetical protein
MEARLLRASVMRREPVGALGRPTGILTWERVMARYNPETDEWEADEEDQPQSGYEGVAQTFDPSVQVGGNFVNEITPPPEASAQPAYAGQAFPGMPIIEEGGRFYAGGQNDYGGQGGSEFNTEAEAMAAREQQAQDPRLQQMFQAREQALAQARTQGGPQQQEPTSIQIMADMARNQLSPADRLEVQQMQNGIARLQRDAREGRVPALQAAQLQADLQRRLAPKMMSMQELRAQQVVLRNTQLREASELETTINARRNQYLAANPAGSVLEHRDPQGNLLGHSVVGFDGRTTFRDHAPNPPSTSGTRGGGSGGSGTRSTGGTADHFDQNYTAASRVVDNMINDTNTSEADRRLLQTPEGRQNAIQKEVRNRLQVHQNLYGENQVQQRLQPGGPMPFDPRGPDEATTTPQRRVELGFVDEIRQAMDNGQTQREGRLRQLAGNFQNVGGDTGRLGEADQKALEQLGYYRNDFNPEVDRAITFAARAQPGPAVRGPDGTVMRQNVQNPQMVEAANVMRQALLTYRGRRPPDSNRQAQIEFDQARGRLGFSTWPPPRQSAATGPAIPTVNVAQAPRPRMPARPISPLQ